jgi:hypothetical protein
LAAVTGRRADHPAEYAHHGAEGDRGTHAGRQRRRAQKMFTIRLSWSYQNSATDVITFHGPRFFQDAVLGPKPQNGKLE